MRYDLQGNYLGDVKVASNLGVRNPACFVFTDSLIVSHQLSLLPIQGNEKKSPFLLLDKQGNVIDSIPSLLPVIPVTTNVVRLNILKSEKARELYGNIGVHGMMTAYFKMMTPLNHHECFQHYGNITEKYDLKRHIWIQSILYPKINYLLI